MIDASICLQLVYLDNPLLDVSISTKAILFPWLKITIVICISCISWPVSIMCSYLEFGKPLVSITDASLTKRLCNVFNPGGNLVKYDICVQIYIFLTKSQVDTN